MRSIHGPIARKPRRSCEEAINTVKLKVGKVTYKKTNGPGFDDHEGLRQDREPRHDYGLF
jgi:hypothetical protein